MGYHYGKTIREHRMLRGMTLYQLASLWPSKESGVTTRYVSDIERGVKSIQDIHVIRDLARLLDIPLWKLGLSEYNPFQETGEISMFFDSDALEELIHDTWLLRMHVPLAVFIAKVEKLSARFSRLIEYNPLLENNKDYLHLLAHCKRLEEVVYTEKRNYEQSLKSAQAMLQLGERAGDMAAQAIANIRIGVELLREDDTEKNLFALQYLEKGSDISLGLSKDVIGFCHAMLARGYAQAGSPEKFERAIETAITFSSGMVGQTVVTSGYVFHCFSGILEEKSNGLILLQQGKKALEVLSEIEKQVALEKNSYLDMWLPLDYAQSFLCENDIEQSITALYQFYDNIKDYKSQRINSKLINHIKQLEDRGYGNERIVREFTERVNFS